MVGGSRSHLITDAEGRESCEPFSHRQLSTEKPAGPKGQAGDVGKDLAGKRQRASGFIPLRVGTGFLLGRRESRGTSALIYLSTLPVDGIDRPFAKANPTCRGGGTAVKNRGRVLQVF